MSDVHGIYIKTNSYYFGHKRLPSDMKLEVTGTGTLEDPYVPVQDGGTTPGIDDVYAIGQAGTANRLIDYTGFGLTSTADTHTFNVPVLNGGFSVIGGDSNNSISFISRTGLAAGVTDPTGDIKAGLRFGINETSSNFEWSLYFDDDKAVYITGLSESGNEQLSMYAKNFTGGGNSALQNLQTSDTTALAVWEANFNDGAKLAKINMYADATEGEIEYNADMHNFQTGDIIITALAGGGTTGLSIDNDGKIIRTP